MQEREPAEFIEADGFVTVHVTKGSVGFVEPMPMDALWGEHRRWSDDTFGLKVGPVGPLKHLSKEALEAAEAPHDITEYADCLFLLWDAVHRAGFTMDQVVAAGFAKMPVLRSRTYPKVADGEPAEHDRSGE